MGCVALHSFRRHGPERLFEVDLLPCHVRHFPQPLAGQEQEADERRWRIVEAVHSPPQGNDFDICQYSLALRFFTRQFGRVDPGAGRHLDAVVGSSHGPSEQFAACSHAWQ